MVNPMVHHKISGLVGLIALSLCACSSDDEQAYGPDPASSDEQRALSEAEAMLDEPRAPRPDLPQSAGDKPQDNTPMTDKSAP